MAAFFLHAKAARTGDRKGKAPSADFFHLHLVDRLIPLRGRNSSLRKNPSVVWWGLLGMIFWWGANGGWPASASGFAEPTEQPPHPKEQPSKDWKIDCPKEGDHLKIIPQKEGVLLEISSERGIGQASIERIGGPWPKPLILRLRLRGLESLRVEAGQWGFEASVMSYPPYKTRLRVHGPDPMPPVDRKSPYWVEVRMLDADGKPTSKPPPEGGCFEVVIPPAFLEKSPKKLQIHWIDFYRE